MKRIKNLVWIIAVVLIAAGAVTACKKDKGKPPVVPPEGTMAIDFSAFSLAGKKGAELPGGTKDIPDPEENFMFSAQMVAIWSSIIAIDLAVPVAAFRQALNQQPVWIAKDTWEWKYQVTGVVGTYKARLVGKNVTAGAEWEMYIKREGVGSFDEFLWFSGTSAADGNSGVWTVNRSSQFPQPYLQIDWTRSGNNITSVKYTYVRVNNDAGQPDPFRTSYIEFGRQTGSYDSYFNIRIFEPVVVQDFVNIQIEWNSTTGAGRAKALHKFSDEEWHCWNNEKFNIVCPS